MFPTGPNKLGAVAAPTAANPMEQKAPFPKSWCGKRGQELINAVNESTGRNLKISPGEKENEFFCHQTGFFLTAPGSELVPACITFCAAKLRNPPRKQNTPEH